MPSITLDWLVSGDGSGPSGAGRLEISAIEPLAKLLIGLAWLAIFVLLVVLAARRRNRLGLQAYWVGGAGLVLGAASSLLLVASIWGPNAGIAVLVESANTLILALTAIILWRYLPRTLTVPSRADLRRANVRLEAEIHDRVAVQAALGAFNAELEERVAARTAELTRSNAELLAEIVEKQQLTAELARARDLAEGANRVKSMFLASMSHDLRTPLNAIIGFSEMILQEVRGPIGHPKYYSYIDDIHRSGHLLLSLINNILDLSKIEAGKQELAQRVVDGRRIAEECIALVAGQTGFAEIEPSLSIYGDGRIYADELALRQIALNLIGNAAKFTPAGGRIAVSLTRSADGGSTVTITDTGIGMDEKGIRKALEPFGQAGLFARPRGSGSGLGLTIVTRLVEAHGGRFAIDSAPGYGTTVRIWFPGPPEERIAEPALRHLVEHSAAAGHQEVTVR
jgi:signal transduction histidine kinase